MPSSFSSTAQSPSFPTASATDVALCASIGRTGRPTVSRKRSREAGPSASRASATVWSEPASITARRTSAAGTSVAWARPSTATASSAPLPDLAGDQAEQEALFVGGGRAHQLADQAGAFGLRTGAGHLADGGEPGVHLAHGEGGLGGRFDRLAQHLPADAEPPLREPARQIRDHDRDVVGLRVPEELREQSDLPGPRRGGGDLLGHMCEPGQQHAAILQRRRPVYTRTAAMPVRRWARPRCRRPRRGRPSADRR